MEDISPLFAVQAEKALQNNNVQLAIDLCERGLKFFPDYLMGYILLAEAYQKIGEEIRRDSILEQVKSKFQASHYTQHIEKIISNVENPPVIESNFVETLSETSEEILPEDVYTEEVITEEEVNIDELAAQGLDANAIEVTEIEDVAEFMVEDTVENEASNEIATEEICKPDEFEQDIENEQSDEFIFQNNDANELIATEPEQQINPNLLSANDLQLIPGIDFIPIRFNYYEVLEFYHNFISQNISEVQAATELTFQAKLNDSVKLGDIVQDFVSEYQVDEKLIDEVEETQQDYENEIVPTATLAMIYEKQKKYQEALDIYEKLLIRTPDKADFYRSKIEEITNILFEM